MLFHIKSYGLILVLFNFEIQLSFDISILLSTPYDTHRAYAGCCKARAPQSQTPGREIKQNPTADAEVLCFEIFPKNANRNLSYKAVGLQHQNN